MADVGREKWQEDGAVLASSSKVRAKMLAEVLGTDNIDCVSVPDSAEANQWQVIATNGTCLVNFSGNVAQIAETKLAWLLELDSTRTRLMVGMDTVPLLLDPGTWLPDFDREKVRYYPHRFRVFHKPRSQENASLQLQTIFRSLVCGYQLRKRLNQLRGLKQSVKEDMNLYLPLRHRGRPWYDGQSAADCLRCEFELHQCYLAATMRVATGIALYVPELQKVITNTPYFDVVFDKIADWVDEDLPQDEIERRIALLAEKVFQVQKDNGKNPEMIPGAIEYSQLARNQDLQDLLGWRLANDIFCSVENAHDIAMGAPRARFEEILSAADYAVQRQSFCPFPEADITGMLEPGADSVRLFQSDLTLAAVVGGLKKTF